MNASIAYVMQGESIGLLCWAYGYPSSTITWSFTPDSGLGFDKASHENSYYSSIEKSKLVDAVSRQVFHLRFQLKLIEKLLSLDHQIAFRI